MECQSNTERDFIKPPPRGLELGDAETRLRERRPSTTRALKSDYYPGDLDWDPLNLKPEDPAEFRLMQERELSHGRLAMLAAFGFMIQEAVTGTTWSSDDVIVENTLLGGWFAAGAAERAQDALAS